MELQYDKEFYGIMCLREDIISSGGSIMFEMKFRSFDETEKSKLKKKIDKTSNLGSCSFKVLKSFCSASSKKSFCANWDESRSFLWANATTEYILSLLSS
jgi:hypothetical protein